MTGARAPLALITPDLAHLPGLVDALQRGWSADNVRGEAAAREMLAAIDRDAAAFVASADDSRARGPPVRLPDGSTVPRLPGVQRWLWDGAFCGVVGFRWASGTEHLPPYVLGHMGYAVVPWKRRRGYATRGLGLMLPCAAKLGLAWVELTTDPDNIASQKVILAQGGRLVERFHKVAAFGGGQSLRFRIDLGPRPAEIDP